MGQFQKNMKLILEYSLMIFGWQSLQIKNKKTLTLLFFDLGSGEILLIVLAIFLVFGPDKIPELARNFGKFINEMKRATDEIKYEINKEADRKEREKKLTEYKAEKSGENDIIEKQDNDNNINITSEKNNTETGDIDDNNIIDKINIKEHGSSLPLNQ